MLFTHSIKITIDNFRSVFKYMLYRIVSAIVFFSIMYVLLRLSLSFIVESAEVAALKDLVKEVVVCIISGNAARLSEIQELGLFQKAVIDIGRLIADGGGAIAGAVVGACLIYLVSRIVDGLATFAMGAIVNDRMSLFARKPFSSAFFSTAGQGILYELIYVPMAFLYDVATLALCWFLFFYLRGLMFPASFLTSLVSLSLFVTAFCCLQALKMTLISAWIPAMIADRVPVRKALALSFKNKEGFGSRFVCFLSTIFIIVAGNIVFGVCTVGGALLLTVPLSFLLLLCIQFVYYYYYNHKKYFITEGEIYLPKQTESEISKKELNI